MNVAVLAQQKPETVYRELMQASSGHPVEDTLARMLASWQCTLGAMPDRLGLDSSQFASMMRQHFPGFEIRKLQMLGIELDPQRVDEMDELHRLLLQNRTQQHPSELWMVDIVVAGCLGNDHLWQDLGLWQRADLSALMQNNFAPLAERNVKDMKWKKFLYKQLCEAEGIYTCRAPSCEVCTDYDNCFGSEE